MGEAVWGADPEFFGPRHAHREGRILAAVRRAEPAPGLHLECAAGVGSLARALARQGRTVVAADTSLRSLAWIARQDRGTPASGRVLPVVADIHQLPFADRTFTSATSAETLEHLDDDVAALSELGRCLGDGGLLAGTVPAGPSQWSDWDVWAGHRRRYTPQSMRRALAAAGFAPSATQWGWPLLRLYDDFFLKRVNRRRLVHDGSVDDDPTLSRVQGLGSRRGLVRLVRSLFAVDRLFDGTPWGVGVLFTAVRQDQRQDSGSP